MRDLAIAVITATAGLLGSAGVFGQGVLSDGTRLEGPGGNVSAWMLQSEGENRASDLVNFLESAKRNGLRWDEIERKAEELYERAQTQQGKGGMGFSIGEPLYWSRAEREFSSRLIVILGRIVWWATKEKIPWDIFKVCLEAHYEQQS